MSADTREQRIQKKQTHQVYLSDLPHFCRELTAEIKPGQVVYLCGPMGAGKTTFTRSLVNALGGTESASPTFALHHSYQLSHELKVARVEHFDLFRVTSSDEFASLGFWDLLTDQPRSIVVIEWAERLLEFALVKTLHQRLAGRETILVEFAFSESAQDLRDVNVTSLI